MIKMPWEILEMSKPVFCKYLLFLSAENPLYLRRINFAFQIQGSAFQVEKQGHSKICVNLPAINHHRASSSTLI